MLGERPERSPTVATTRADPLAMADTFPCRSTVRTPAGSVDHVTCSVSSTYACGLKLVYTRADICNGLPPSTIQLPPETEIDTILSAGGSGETGTGVTGAGEVGVSRLQLESMIAHR